MNDTNQLSLILAHAGAPGASGFLSTLNAWHVVALLVGGAAMHVYHAVVNGGGYVMIWRRFKYGPTGRAVGSGVGAAATGGTTAAGVAGAQGPAARFVPQTSRVMAAAPAVLGRPAGSVSGVAGVGKLVPSAKDNGHLTPALSPDLAVGRDAERGNVKGAVGNAGASVASPVFGASGAASATAVASGSGVGEAAVSASELAGGAGSGARGATRPTTVMAGNAVGGSREAVNSTSITSTVKAGVVLMVVWFAMVMRATGTLTIAPLLNYQALSGTNFTGAVAISNAYVPPRTLVIQNGGLATTNTAFVDAQISLDNTNFITLGTYTPSVTNAGIYTYAPAMNDVTIYFRARVGLTNASSVSVQSLQTQ